jgi:hypothetical protein
MKMEFRCRVCKEMRPDAQISVKSLDTSKQFNMPLGTIRQNFNYCNDRDVCTARAAQWTGEDPV